MFLDGRCVPPGTGLRSDFCIIGTGPAGISIALAFEKAGFATILLEAGGLNFDHGSQQLYGGQSDPSSYDIVHSRTRQFGGSSNCWGGWSRPFAPIDFQTRPWVPYSGWPVPLAELAPYQTRAHRLLDLNDMSYVADHWADFGRRRGAPLLDMRGSGLENVISQLSLPTRFGRSYRELFAKSAQCTVILNAPVVEIVSNAESRQVEEVVVVRPDRQHYRVIARTFVLASGGIENARLLLNSRTHNPAGLGNGHGMVGRFFMDHPRVRLAKLRLAPGALSSSRYYDVSYYSGNAGFRRDGVATAASIGLACDVQAKEGLVQAHLGLIGNYIFEDSRAVSATKRLVRRLIRKNVPAVSGSAMVSGVAGLPLAAMTLLARQSRSRRLVRDFTIQVVLEPRPDPDNMVMLAAGRDSLGLQQAKVRWRISDQEKGSYWRCVGLFKTRIESAGLGKVDITDPGDVSWDTAAETTWHHMGATRMDRDPKRGVVDTNCRVHGIANLYVAGSSIFPTGGGNMPTLNIVALALRLADHLVAQAR